LDVVKKIEEDIAPLLDDLGYSLFRVTFSGGKGGILQIMAENKDDKPLSLDDCTRISRAVSAKLDVEDYIKYNYMLEVSSPGLDRPLIHADDFDKYRGRQAKVELRNPINRQKKFVGVIKARNKDQVTLTVDGNDVSFPYDDIVKAKLTITDDVFKTEKE